jgi:hypothetical protein
MISSKDAAVRQSLLVLFPALSLLTGCAAAPATTTKVEQSAMSEGAAPGRRCFAEQQIRNFRSTRTGTLYLKVWGANAGTYQLSTSGGCLDLDSAQQLAVRPGIGSGRLCTGDWATVAAPGSSGSPQVCRALIEKRLTDAELEAMPARDRP